MNKHEYVSLENLQHYHKLLMDMLNKRFNNIANQIEDLNGESFIIAQGEKEEDE